MLHDTGAPALYLPALKTAETAEHGNVQVLLEVQAVNATGDKQRSWFTGDDKVIGGEKANQYIPNCKSQLNQMRETCYSDGKMLLLTPFDPVFLLVRILLVVGQSQKVSQTRLQPVHILALTFLASSRTAKHGFHYRMKTSSIRPALFCVSQALARRRLTRPVRAVKDRS